MLKIIARRLLLSIPLLFIVSAITFFLGSLVPGDPARALLGISATQKQYEALRQALHLTKPVWDQYWLYVKGAVRGDLGRSIFTDEPVGQMIATRLPVTLALLIGATVLSAAIGVPLGVHSATSGRVARRIGDVLSLVGSALPNFWVALVLVSIFSVALSWLPATGYTTFGQSPTQWAESLILPVIALSIGGVALIAKVTRDSMLTTLRLDYVRTLRASGVGERSIIWRHALRNSGAVVVTTVGLTLINFIPGTVLVENVFVLPGLGNAVVSATNEHDIPVVQGIAIIFTLIVIAANLLVDLAYGILNPKVSAN